MRFTFSGSDDKLTKARLNSVPVGTKTLVLEADDETYTNTPLLKRLLARGSETLCAKATATTCEHVS